MELPSEIWEYILEMQSDLVSFVNMSSVSQLFRNLINSKMLVKFIDEIVFINDVQFSNFWFKLIKPLLQNHVIIKDTPFAIPKNQYIEYKTTLLNLERYIYCYINLQTEKICHYAIIRCIMSFRDVRIQTRGLCLIMVKKDWRNLEHINVENQTEKIIMIAVKRTYDALKYIKDENKYHIVCLKLVHKKAKALKYIDKQTDEICLVAVRRSWRMLEYVQNQTEEICMAAIKQCGCALKYVRNQTIDICMAAIKQYPNAHQYMKI